MAQWRSWLARKPVTLEVEGSSPFWVANIFSFCFPASVAQLVEQRTENPRVVGSIPTGGTIYSHNNVYYIDADLAHSVERDLAKVEVAGSSPVVRSRAYPP